MILTCQLTMSFASPGSPPPCSWWRSDSMVLPVPGNSTPVQFCLPWIISHSAAACIWACSLRDTGWPGWRWLGTGWFTADDGPEGPETCDSVNDMTHESCRNSETIKRVIPWWENPFSMQAVDPQVWACPGCMKDMLHLVMPHWRHCCHFWSILWISTWWKAKKNILLVLPGAHCNLENLFHAVPVSHTWDNLSRQSSKTKTSNSLGEYPLNKFFSGQLKSYAL